MGFNEGRVALGAVSQYRNVGIFGDLTLCKLCQQKLVKTSQLFRLKSHYAVLGISSSATQKEIRDAYIKLSKKEHPDQNKSDKKSHDRFVKINEAYAVLSKDSSRRNYDMKLRYQQGYTAQSSSQPGYNPYGQTPYNEQFYNRSQYQHYGGGSGPHGFSQSSSGYNFYGDGDSPFGKNYERRSSEPEVSTAFTIVILVMLSTVLVMLRLYLYYIVANGQPHGAEAERAVNEADDMKIVNIFSVSYKFLSGILLLVVAYEILAFINLYITHQVGVNSEEVLSSRWGRYKDIASCINLAWLILLVSMVAVDMCSSLKRQMNARKLAVQKERTGSDTSAKKIVNAYPSEST